MVRELSRGALPEGGTLSRPAPPVHPGGPRCYPTCLKVVLQAQFAGDRRSPEQEDQLQDILAHDEGYWATVEGRGNGEASHSAILFYFMHVLAKPIREGAAASA
jgi:hypothetical protein